MKNIKNMHLYSSQFIDVWNDQLVLVSYVSNHIYLIDINKHCISDVIYIDTPDCQDILYRAFCCVGNELLLVPYNAEFFCVVNLNNKIITRIGNNELLGEGEKKRKFYRVILHGSTAYVLGESIHEIIVVDMNNKQITSILKYKKDTFWTSSYATKGELLFVPSRSKDEMLCIDTTTKNARIISIERKGNAKGFLDIYIKDDEIHLFDEVGNEYLWDPKGRSAHCISKDDEFRFTSRQIMRYGNRTYRIALYEDEIYCRDGEGIFTAIDCQIHQADVIGICSRFQEGIMINKHYFFQSRQGKIYQLDMDTNQVDEICIQMNNEHKQYRKHFMMAYSKYKVLKENEDFEFEEFLKMLVDS